MRWLTPQECANLTGQSANQVMKAIKHGAIAASYSPHPRGKGRWWIAEDEAERYRATQTAGVVTMGDQTEVTYRSIDGFPGYRVGNDGSVWSCFRRGGIGQPRSLDGPWKQLRPQRGDQGHQRVTLYRFADGAAPRILVHHLVLVSFVGPRPAGMEGCHGDGNPTNNALGNLRWGTPIENWADRKRHGRARSWSKLVREQVDRARAMRASGRTYRQIGAALGISDTQASNICRGKQWKESA